MPKQPGPYTICDIPIFGTITFKLMESSKNNNKKIQTKQYKICYETEHDGDKNDNNDGREEVLDEKEDEENSDTYHEEEEDKHDNIKRRVESK